MSEKKNELNEENLEQVSGGAGILGGHDGARFIWPQINSVSSEQSTEAWVNKVSEKES